ELNASVNRLARLLIRRGAGPEQIVAIALPRSVEMVAAIFAVLRTGAAYLPIDLDLPAERIGLMVDDAEPLCVLSTSRAAADLPAGATDTVMIDEAATIEALSASPDGPLTAVELGVFGAGRA